MCLKVKTGKNTNKGSNCDALPRETPDVAPVVLRFITRSIIRAVETGFKNVAVRRRFQVLFFTMHMENLPSIYFQSI